ncbi:unnamed protein product [Schistocephalus solidus]|uniref:Transposase n=1 Tax=Schistocephalus solidus TaxID=70667 RepID=A0A183TG00_SCHSO|nr:unnamed protein product [Schistocephalus solidus]
MRQKVTWVHPRSRHWHILDYVLVRRRDQQDVLVIKAIPVPTDKRITASFDDKGPAINALLVEKNHLHKAYVDRPTAVNKTAFYRSRRLIQHWLREMQDAWMTRKAHADRNERKNFFATTKAAYAPPSKVPPIFSVPTAGRCSHWAEHFPPSIDCLKWKSTPTLICRPLSKKPSEPCSTLHRESTWLERYPC